MKKLSSLKQANKEEIVGKVELNLKEIYKLRYMDLFSLYKEHYF